MQRNKFIKTSTIDIVRRLLKDHPHLRDDDNRLIANIWYQTSPNISEGALDFLNEIAEGNLPSSESIRRCRQKLQQIDKGLRGKLWNKRHGMQNEVREELHNIEKNYEKDSATF